MKTSLKLVAFLLAVSIPGAALAETLGARIPASLSIENLIGAFSVALIGLLLTADYARRSRVTARALTAAPRGRETHCLAA